MSSRQSRPGTPGKPRIEATRLAKQYIGCDEEGFPQDEVELDIEFGTAHPEHICLQRHRGNYGRLLCYVHKDGENYNLKTVREGWSPYFVKYGRSRLYHEELLSAEAEAQAAAQKNPITVLCDLQGGIKLRPGDGALIFSGSPTHKFNLWIPDRSGDSAQAILRLIEKRYAGQGYVYVTGRAKLYNDKPEIMLSDTVQLSDKTG